MVSISQVKLDELNRTIEELQGVNNRDVTLRALMKKEIDNFDEILDKIVRAANGGPINTSRGYDYGQVVGSNYDGPSHRCTPFTTEEIRAAEIEGLREQTMMLAERLAAVSAIAQFAREHKA